MKETQVNLLFFPFLNWTYTFEREDAIITLPIFTGGTLVFTKNIVLHSSHSLCHYYSDKDYIKYRWSGNTPKLKPTSWLPFYVVVCRFFQTSFQVSVHQLYLVISHLLRHFVILNHHFPGIHLEYYQSLSPFIFLVLTRHIWELYHQMLHYGESHTHGI